MIPPDEIAQTILATLSLQSVYALVLFPLIWGMVKCIQSKSPLWQHGFWLLLLLRLVLPPDMATPWSASHLIRSLVPQPVHRQYVTLPYEFGAFQEHQELTATAIPDVMMPDKRHPSEEFSAINCDKTKASSPFRVKWLCQSLCGAYLTVVVFLLVLFMRTRRRFWKIARQAKTVSDPAVLDIIQTWRRRLHISRTIEVKTADSDVPPYTIGTFRPVVVLPENLISSVGNTGLEPILAHELVHAKRRDDLAICLQELVRVVYFFHPLVWFVIPRLTWTREAVCDLTVLFHGTISPRTYGRQLLALGPREGYQKMHPKGLAVFTSAARGMAFRLKQIQKEEHMAHRPFFVYLTVMIVGLFLLPMAPVASSAQGSQTADQSTPVSQAQARVGDRLASNALTEFILQCVPCKNPDEISRIIWGDFMSGGFQEADFPELVAATDCDIVDNIGNGHKAYVFYLLSDSRQGVYRPNFHFIMIKDQLKLLFKSRNLANYATDRATVNGRYEIEEGWRADLFDGIDDDRVNLAWGNAVWFWSGSRYVKAYTDYTIEGAADPSLLGTRREWEADHRSVYEAAPRR